MSLHPLARVNPMTVIREGGDPPRVKKKKKKERLIVLPFESLSM
jgi:hypothetical protein